MKNAVTAGCSANHHPFVVGKLAQIDFSRLEVLHAMPAVLAALFEGQGGGQLSQIAARVSLMHRKKHSASRLAIICVASILVGGCLITPTLLLSSLGKLPRTVDPDDITALTVHFMLLVMVLFFVAVACLHSSQLKGDQIAKEVAPFKTFVCDLERKMLTLGFDGLDLTDVGGLSDLESRVGAALVGAAHRVILAEGQFDKVRFDTSVSQDKVAISGADLIDLRGSFDHVLDVATQTFPTFAFRRGVIFRAAFDKTQP